MSATVAPFDPFRALGVLADHRVRFIVIGGFAGRIWGSPTLNLDVVGTPAGSGGFDTLIRTAEKVDLDGRRWSRVS